MNEEQQTNMFRVEQNIHEFLNDLKQPRNNQTLNEGISTLGNILGSYTQEITNIIMELLNKPEIFEKLDFNNIDFSSIEKKCEKTKDFLEEHEKEIFTCLVIIAVAIIIIIIVKTNGTAAMAAGQAAATNVILKILQNVARQAIRRISIKNISPKNKKMFFDTIMNIIRNAEKNIQKAANKKKPDTHFKPQNKTDKPKGQFNINPQDHKPNVTPQNKPNAPESNFNTNLDEYIKQNPNVMQQNKPKETGNKCDFNAQTPENVFESIGRVVMGLNDVIASSREIFTYNGVDALSEIERTIYEIEHPHIEEIKEIAKNMQRPRPRPFFNVQEPSYTSFPNNRIIETIAQKQKEEKEEPKQTPKPRSREMTDERFNKIAEGIVREIVRASKNRSIASYEYFKDRG